MGDRAGEASGIAAPRPDRFEIAPVRPDQVGLLWGLVQRFARYQGVAEPLEGSEALLADALFGAVGHAHAWLLRLDGEVAGYCLYFVAFSSFLARPVLFVEDVFVEAHARGRGLGSRVFERLRDEAARRGCGRLEWCAHASSPDTLRFYQRLGAEEQAGVVHLRWPVHDGRSS